MHDLGNKKQKDKEETMSAKHNLIFLGPPGVGKGTIADLISSDTGLIHISTGEIFRNEIKNRTALGIKAEKYVTSGGLVPDNIVAELVCARLAKNDCDNGFIFDGFPRTLPQADIVEKVLSEMGRAVDLVISLEANEELLIQRLTARLTCKKCGINFNKLFAPPKNEGVCDKCGGELYQRVDDSLETALDRIEVYKKETAPLIDYYKKKELLASVSSEQKINKIVQEVMKVIS